MTRRFDIGGDFPPANEADWRAALKESDPHSLARLDEDGIVITPVYHRPTPLPRMARPAALAKGHGWAIVQPAATPERLDEELAHGADGATLVIAGAPLSDGGMTPARAVAALEARDVEFTPLRLDAGENWPEAAAAVLDAYRRRHYDLARAPLLLCADPFGPAARAGRRPETSELASRLAGLFRQARAAGLGRPAFAADTRVFHAAGCTPAQELAIAAAATVEFVRLLSSHGAASADDALQAVSWLMTVDAAQFASIAKLRAARLMHGRIAEALGAAGAPLTLLAESAWRMFTARDVHNNLVRLTSATFAAALGGADALTTHAYDLARGGSDRRARRMARNAQIIARAEAGLDVVDDPLNGSYFLDAYTHELARAGWALFQRIEARGGLLAALEGDWLQGQIETAARRRNVTLIGVDLHPAEEEEEVTTAGETAPGADADIPPLAPVRLEALARGEDES
ncbi:MAG TPA: hypothetical protein ENK15_05185 [Thermopetrobacter sp.]|nr:hypothetical protein [Thermopetrobacter sp.]